ncbi:MAG: hypothetical protein AAF485_18630 [Chloroflexota bacterium]
MGVGGPNAYHDCEPMGVSPLAPVLSRIGATRFGRRGGSLRFAQMSTMNGSLAEGRGTVSAGFDSLETEMRNEVLVPKEKRLRAKLEGVHESLIQVGAYLRRRNANRLTKHAPSRLTAVGSGTPSSSISATCMMPWLIRRVGNNRR